MGSETTTTVRIDGHIAKAHVLLEGAELICRGGWKRKFLHSEMSGLTARSGRLEFQCGQERVAIHLGEAAEQWLLKIQNPRSRIDKLGVKPSMKVCVLGRADDSLAEIAAALGVDPSRRLGTNMDLCLCFMAEPGDLQRLDSVAQKLAPRGAVWALWPKGQKNFAHEHVVAAARRAGLSTTKSMGFSDLLTGLRLVRSKRA